MSNPTADEWDQRITNDGISALEVWAIIHQMKRLEQRIRELEEQLRLANVDADRLYWRLHHLEHCGLPVSPDETHALRLHEQLRNKKG